MIVVTSYCSPRSRRESTESIRPFVKFSDQNYRIENENRTRSSSAQLQKGLIAKALVQTLSDWVKPIHQAK